MLPLPAVLMMVAEVPDKIVDQMNNYLDKLLLQEDRKSSDEKDTDSSEGKGRKK